MPRRYFLRVAEAIAEDNSHAMATALGADIGRLLNKFNQTINDIETQANKLLSGDYFSGGSNDSNGVLSEIAIITGRIYTEAFAQKGSFSPVKFVKSGKGGILVLRSDTSLEQKTLPVFSAVLDLMFRTLGSRNTHITGADFLLDEFRKRRI